MKLFEPGKIGRLSLKNRILMAAMGIGGLAEPDGRFSQRAVDYYAARARGGAGMIVTGAVSTRQIEELPFAPLGGDVVIDGMYYIARLSELADVVHDYGAKVAVQVNAGFGRMAGAEVIRRGDPVAPSAMPCVFNPGRMARALTVEEIERLVQSFQFAAEAMCTAGVDAIEINCYGGYLADQFMTSLWNKRTDKYGGDLDGRLRFVWETIDGIKKGAGADYPIIIKYSLMHGIEGGREIEEGLEVGRRLEAAGVAALEIGAGCYETWYLAKPPTYSEPGFLVGLAETVKKTVSIPVIAVGKLGYAALAESVLQEGKADFIALGRALLADPDWPNKVKEGRLEDIRPCLGDHEGCSGRTAQSKYISCVVNPATGMEKEFDITPAPKRKSVLIVGGGPGGMEAARVAALRGHRVALWERASALGGNLIPAAVPGFKKDYGSLIEYLSIQTKKLGVNVELGKEATPEMIRGAKADAIIIATGSVPCIPDIPGVKRGNVVTAIDVLLGRKKAGQRVVVIGGGIVGCEVALHLAQQGKRLTVVEIERLVLRDMYSANRMYLLKLLADADVSVLAETRTPEIKDGGVVVAGKDGKSRLSEADTVVLAIGAKPNRNLLEALGDSMPEIYAIGDCVEPRKVMNAIWEGFRTSRLI